MTGFIHGVRVREISGGIAGAAAAIADIVPPVITSPRYGRVDANKPYEVKLVARGGAVFQIRDGADGSEFALAVDVLKLPGQPYDADEPDLVCRLRAIDGAGNVTDFVHAVTIVDAGVKLGALDFSDPDNSAFIR